MNDVKSFSFFKSYYEAVNSLNEEDKKTMLISIVDYVFEDVEPDLDGPNKAIWIFIKMSLDTSKERSKLGKMKSNEEQNEIKMKSNEEQNEIKMKSNEEQNEIKMKSNEEQNENNSRNHIHILNSYSYSNNNLEEIGYGEEKPLLVADDTGLLAETTKKAIDYLNEIANTNFRTSSKMTKGKIQARLNEGYRLNDFTVVIEKKAKEWIGTEFEKYLCPETLFGNKFEKYLNQKVVEPKAKETKRDKTMDVLRGVYDGSIKIN